MSVLQQQSDGLGISVWVTGHPQQGAARGGYPGQCALELTLFLHGPLPQVKLDEEAVEPVPQAGFETVPVYGTIPI